MLIVVLYFDNMRRCYFACPTLANTTDTYITSETYTPGIFVADFITRTLELGSSFLNSSVNLLLSAACCRRAIYGLIEADLF